MTAPPAGSDDDDSLPAYGHRPRPVGFEIGYRLDGDKLLVDQVRRQDAIALADVRQVRFLFRPGNFSSRGYRIKLYLKDGRTLSFGSLSWKSMVEMERRDAAYGRFVRALCARIAEASPAARFVAGQRPFVWWTLAGVVGLIFALMALLTVRAAFARDMPTLAVGAVILAFAGWQMIPQVRLNRPLELATGEIPAHLVPGG